MLSDSRVALHSNVMESEGLVARGGMGTSVNRRANLTRFRRRLVAQAIDSYRRDGSRFDAYLHMLPNEHYGSADRLTNLVFGDPQSGANLLSSE